MLVRHHPHKNENTKDDRTYRKYAPHDEIVMLPQTGLVPLGERLGEFDARVCLGGVESLVRERQTAKEPHEAFCCSVFFLGSFVEREELERGRLGWLSEVAGANFLLKRCF